MNHGGLFFQVHSAQADMKAEIFSHRIDSCIEIPENGYSRECRRSRCL
jgi:hypothetical protein